MQGAPHGAWKSPIGAESAATASVKLEELHIVPDAVLWTERRPDEGGRTALCRYTDAHGVTPLLPVPWSVRTRVHEYGGGAFMAHGREVYLANQDTQLWHRLDEQGTISAVTYDSQVYHADLCPARSALIAVQEDHRGEGPPVNRLVLLGQGATTVLAEGADFYSSPQVHEVSGRMAWLSWSHPQMPWDGTDLWVRALDGGDDILVAGGPSESVFQPQWAPDGSLYFVSDRSGWWNLYRWNGRESVAVLPMEAEFGRPQWAFGMSTYAVVGPRRLVCSWFDGDRWQLGQCQDGLLQPFDLDFTEYRHVRASETHAYAIAEHPQRPAIVMRLELSTGRWDALREAGPAGDTRYYSMPESIRFTTRQGGPGYARFYRPTHAEQAGLPGEKPPLVVHSHGGPTGAAHTSLNIELQYWTSRGIAVLDVDYGGSTGYGRAYRERLRGQWGVVDVQDCVDAALHMVALGEADGNRLAITGSSAGGYTTLAVLAFTHVFKAGASRYGISDLESLQLETHKFESHYNDSLVGPYPEAVEVYRQRSPIHHLEGFSCPLILLQGTADKVVPRQQAEAMFAAVKRKGLPVALLLFEGEDHGFRQAANIQRALEAEFAFFAMVFGYTPADDLPALAVENMASLHVRGVENEEVMTP